MMFCGDNPKRTLARLVITINYHADVSGQPIKLSTLLRQWRDRNGWKQAFAAAKLGVNVHTYRNWEQGKCEPQGLARDTVLKTIEPTDP